MTIRRVIRLDLVQKVLAEALETGSGETVSWAYRGPDFDDLQSLVSLRVYSGPTPTQSLPTSRAFLPPSSIALTVTAGVGELASMNVCGIVYSHEVAVDAEEARDALIVAVNEDTEATITAAAHADTDKLVLTPKFLGGIWGLRVAGLESSVVAYADDMVTVAHTKNRLTIGLSAYSRVPNLRGGATPIADICRATLMDRVAQDLLRRHNIHVEFLSANSDLTETVRDTWESRSSFDIDLLVPGTTVSTVDQITSVVIDPTLSVPS